MRLLGQGSYLKLFPAGWMYQFAPGMFAFLNISAMLLYVYLYVCGRMLLLLHVRAWHVRLPQRLRHSSVRMRTYADVCASYCMFAFLNACAMLLCVC